MCGGFRVSHNGKRLCEGGAKKFKTFYKFFPEQKPFSFFQNYKKIKNEMVFGEEPKLKIA